MERKLKSLFSLTAIKHLRYLPLIILRVKNWVTFLTNYLGLKNNPNTLYSFRNGLKVWTKDTIDVATLAVVFIKKDYGSIPDNSIIVDIGANIGAFSLYAASMARNVAVYAYEPTKSTFELLLKNLQINKCGAVKALNLGVAAERGEKALYLGGSSPFHSLYPSGNEDFIEIYCVTLKDIFLENRLNHIDLLKIDCEGAEYEILYKVSPDVLRRIREIRMEYHAKSGEKNTIAELTAWLQTLGFTRTFYRADSDKYGNAWFKLDAPMY